MKKISLLFFGLVGLLTACSGPHHVAPVIDISHYTPSPNIVHKRPRSTMVPQTGARKNTKRPSLALSWVWPMQGKVIRLFSAVSTGIDIAGQQGEPICAAAAGRVVYSGKTRQGQGKLLVLKHNKRYSSVYVHYQVSLVKKGNWVRKGQKIAKIANTGRKGSILHFEIRRAGKPIDPVILYQAG